MRVRAGLIVGPGTIEILPAAEEMLDIDLGDERPHIACCLVDRFFCGKQFHEELIGYGFAEDDCCETCVKIRYEMLCPVLRPTHSHCPIPLLARRVCPDPR